MKYDLFGLEEARAISDILQSCFTYKALLLANHLFPTINCPYVGQPDNQIG